MKEVRIIGIMIKEPSAGADKLQGILTKYGCSIRTRLGLHDIGMDNSEESGLILLELIGESKECFNLEKELQSIGNLEVQKMTFVR